MDKRLRQLYEEHAAQLLQIPGNGEGDYAHPVFGEGPADARLLLLGEAPGAQEAAMGRPFVGRAGENLDAMLALAGLSRSEIYITNAVKFRPTRSRTGRRGTSLSNRTPRPAEVEAGLPLLRAELHALAPRVVASLGNTPLGALLRLAGQGEKAAVGDVHGRALRLRLGAEQEGEADLRFWLFPLYHPASLLYRPALKPVFEADMHALGRFVREEGGRAWES